ncbi:AMP-dependent synthetase and ligase [Candidatus Zixiibacteriota bacterium]|nr:AMP-dependent synthetase and ligase [candidate division Zixibacteria bacterium]
MRIFDILANSAAVYPGNIAVRHDGRSMNYRELYESAVGLGKYLETLRLPPDTRAAILFENCAEYLIAFFAVFRAGLVAVPLDTSLPPEKINAILIDSQAEILLCQAKFERHLDRMMGDTPPIKFIITERKLQRPPETVVGATLEEILSDPNLKDKIFPEKKSADSLAYDLKQESVAAPHELAAIFYTSGSTGSSKGVMLSHRNLISNTIATVIYLKLEARDKVMVILPFYYIYGNSLLLTHILAGGTLVIDNRFLYPEVVLDTMQKEQVTGFSGVPSNFMIMLNNSSLATRSWPHLRYFTQAGGAMAPEVVRRLMTAFPDKEIYIMYGQTEAAPRVSYCPPEKLNEKIGSIGIPVPGVTIKVMDDDGHEVPIGTDGELAVLGDNVMLGYWNQPEEQKQVLRDGWLFTGDLARQDRDGYFYIVGRKKEIIKAGGKRVSAKEVEECILEHPQVAEATVFGIKDDILGEAIKTVIVLRQGTDLSVKEIQNYCRSKLAEFKVPKYIVFADSLPKYKSGKVNKMLLMNKSV